MSSGHLGRTTADLVTQMDHHVAREDQAVLVAEGHRAHVMLREPYRDVVPLRHVCHSRRCTQRQRSDKETGATPAFTNETLRTRPRLRMRPFLPV